jgi:hypothetical protein
VLLAEAEVEPVLETLKAAFPKLSDWEYCNEEDGDHNGFTVWGCLTIKDGDHDFSARDYYVTFDIHAKQGQGKGQWRGTLSIGQHSYFWSSADAGDASLLDTAFCASLSEAITALKSQIRDFASALSAI